MWACRTDTKAGWLFLIAPCVPLDATEEEEEEGLGGGEVVGAPPAAPHGETVHVHIGAGSLLCRPAGATPPPTPNQRGRKVNNQRQEEARLRCGQRKELFLSRSPLSGGTCTKGKDGILNPDRHDGMVCPCLVSILSSP